MKYPYNFEYVYVGQSPMTPLQCALQQSVMIDNAALPPPKLNDWCNTKTQCGVCPTWALSQCLTLQSALSPRSVVVPVKKPPPGSLAVNTVGTPTAGGGMASGSTPNIFAAATATPKSMINTTGEPAACRTSRLVFQYRVQIFCLTHLFIQYGVKVLGERKRCSNDDLFWWKLMILYVCQNHFETSPNTSQVFFLLRHWLVFG